MYGTDWPIVNLGECVEFIKRLIPERHWERISFHNANRIYHLGLKKEAPYGASFFNPFSMRFG